MSTSSSMMIMLQSSDCQIFEVKEKVARMSETVNTLLQDLGNTDYKEPVPLANVRSDILKLVLKWADHHKDDPKIEEVNNNKVFRKLNLDKIKIPEWDAQFFKMIMDHGTLVEIILAANYMDMKPLQDLATTTVANQIRGKTAEEIRQIYNIPNDFTDEEKAQIKREEEWDESHKE